MDSDDETPYSSEDGNTLYFASWGTHGFQYPQWMGPVDLFRAHYNGQNWGNIEIMPVPVTTGYWETGPAISNDGVILYFSSTRQGGPGAPDIYETHFVSAINDDSAVDSTLPEITIFPNPSNSSFAISVNGVNGSGILSIYNIEGQKVFELSINSNNRHVRWDTSDKGKPVSSGAYFARFENSGRAITEKLILIK